jgi:membrane-bound serine protease (ClpP class)
MSGRRGLGPLVAVLALLAFLPRPASAAGPVVDVATLDGDINSITASYIASVVDRASSDHAGALVIVTNTPGGISTAMDGIIGSLLSSPVPTVVYVSPAGARAASAGLFVAQAADVVAMAPGTNIGSAHPISGGGTDLTGDLGRKVLNDAVARIRGLADLHGRNADWCEKAVRDSVNIGATEAVSLHVADLEAHDLATLLKQIDGRTAHRPHGSDVTFKTAGAEVVDIPMSPLQFLLHALINPDVAYLLMLVAIYGLIAEVTTPGAVFPGVIGVISALLALVSLTSLPVNIAGALLILFAFVLFVIDIKAPTHGVLTAGGLIALLLGSAFLIDTGPIGIGVSPWLIAAAGLLSAGFFAIVIRKVVAARLRQPAVGPESLVGEIGRAREDLDPDGMVFVAGALWRATAQGGQIPAGSDVRVVGREGLTLRVELATNELQAAAAEEKKP